MTDAEQLKHFINEFIDEINSGDFIKVYGMLLMRSPAKIRIFTDMMYRSGIDVIQYLNGIPNHFYEKICPWTTLHLPSHIKSISNYAFGECEKLKEVTSLNVSVLDSSCFAYCYNLEKITFGSLYNIGDGVFQSCYALKTVSLPDSLRIIGNGAFAHCETLKSIDVKRVGIIGEHAFQNCYNLEEVKYAGRMFDWKDVCEEGVFDGCKKLKKITCKDGDIQL